MTCDVVTHWTSNYRVRTCTDSACNKFTGREGAPLYEILKAGEWASPAFLKYLDLHTLECDAVVEAHVDESDGEA